VDTNTWATIAALITCAITLVQAQRKEPLRSAVRDQRGSHRGQRSETELGARIDGLDRRLDTKFDALSGQVYDLHTRVTAALGLPAPPTAEQAHNRGRPKRPGALR